MRSLLPLGISDINSSNLGSEERAYSTLLPNYDEAVAQYMKQAPPPSYQVAMSNYQPQEEPTIVVGVNGTGNEDNNNDSSNNNNTVHINNNTPPMRRNEIAAASTEPDDVGAVGGITNTEDVTPPPSYKDVIIEPVSPGGDNDTSTQNVNSSLSATVQANNGESQA